MYDLVHISRRRLQAKSLWAQASLHPHIGPGFLAEAVNSLITSEMTPRILSSTRPSRDDGHP